MPSNLNDEADTFDEKIIQNALIILATGEILISTHRHDYVSVVHNGEQFMVDGGLDYIRRSGRAGRRGADGATAEDLSVFLSSPIEDKVYKLLWGTRGKDGTQPLKYVFLRDCETDHLRRIAEMAGPEHSMVAKLILGMRKVVPDWGIGYSLEKVKG